MRTLLEKLLERAAWAAEDGQGTAATGGSSAEGSAAGGGEADGKAGGDGSAGGEGGAPKAGGEGGAGAEGSEGAAGNGADGEGGKPADGEAPTTLTADDIKLPDGFTASEETVSEFLGVLNNAEGTPQERADQLIDLHQRMVAETIENQAKAWTERQLEMRKEITEGKEFGGANLEANQAIISSVLQEFGSPELNEAIDATGIGDNPSFYRFLHKIGSLMSEGKPIVGTSTSGEKPPLEERMYPNQGKT